MLTLQNNLENVLKCTKKRDPDFSNLASILECQKPKRNTLFEFFLNQNLYKLGSGIKKIESHLDYCMAMLFSYRNFGYDYATISPPRELHFQKHKIESKNTRSLNHTPTITDKKSLNAYVWPDVSSFDYSYLDTLSKETPKGMKLITHLPSGILENTIELVGYDNLCFKLIDEPELMQDVFDNIGQTLFNHTKKCLEYKKVGACILNDDWGFNTQTMISPNDLRKYVIPWYKRTVELIHKEGRYAILHSCGNLKEVYDDIIDDIGFDGKHSYEDNIQPVEDAYNILKSRIAVLGGIDLDYIYQNSIEDIYNRSLNMLEKAKDTGGYALGTGNSVPEYIETQKYFAMILACIQ